MNIDQILDTWSEDCKLNLAEPGRESIKIPSLHAKYLRILSEAKLKLKEVRNRFAETKYTKWNYYNGNYNTDKAKLLELGLEPFKRTIIKSDINIYLDSDKDLISLGNKIVYYEEIISATTQIMLSLKNRVWEIKNYIDFTKFQEGS